MFSEVLHDKSAQTKLLKEMWVLISKGLKHLNTVLGSCLPNNCNKSDNKQPIDGSTTGIIPEELVTWEVFYIACIYRQRSGTARKKY